MNKQTTIAVVSILAGIFLFSACSLGLEPSWKANNRATLSLTIPVLNTTSDLFSGRAVIQGGGNLYIRTLGSPVTLEGALYGPYKIIPGKVFSTTDIPPATYTGIGFIYAVEELDTKSFVYLGKTSTFRDLMKMPDADFNIFTSGSGGNAPFNSVLNGDASGFLVKDFTIAAGVTNSITVLLAPITGPDTTVDLSATQSYNFVSGTPGAMVRKFLNLRNINPTPGMKITELICTLTPVSAPTNLGIVALYDEPGNKIQAQSPAGLISAPVVFTVPYTGGYSFYLYFECMASDLRLDFTKTEVSDTAPVTSYVVTFDSQGASVPASPGSLSVTPPTLVTGSLPALPQRPGWAFGGWFTAVNGGGSAFTASTPVTADITVYALWNTVNYTVTYNSDGGSTVAPYIVTTPSFNVGALPAAPTKAGFNFAGWYTEVNGGGTAFTSSTLVDSNITVYAYWTTSAVYTVSFEKNDVLATGATPTQTMPSGIPTSLNSNGFNKPGWTFTGWGIAAGGPVVYPNEGMYTMGSADVTLYAQWAILLSSDADLTSLSASPVTLNPAFMPITVTYNAAAGNSLMNVMVTPASSHPGATIRVKINGGSYNTLASGTTSNSLMLDDPMGNNVISVEVTAEDLVTVKIYTIIVTKTVMVSIMNGTGGSVSPMGSPEYTPGSSVPITATPNPGYRFMNWSGTASVVPVNSSSATLTVGLMSSSTMANFEPDFAGGSGTPGDPYLVSNLTQLRNMNYFRNMYFRLTANIDMSGEPNWVPIGDTTTHFSGGLEGNGFTVSGLTITSAITDAGLFGVTEGATLFGITLTGINVNGAFYTGGLVGRIFTAGSTEITNCSVSGAIHGAQMVGGLVGGKENGGTLTITNCATNVTIDSTMYGNIGGIIGRSFEVTISRSSASGSINQAGGTPNDYIGGLIGYNSGSSVSDCYASGNVTGAAWVGGMIGSNATSPVTNSYSYGLVQGAATLGGLIGSNDASAVTSCYYDSTTSGRNDTGKGMGYPTATMLSAGTYAGWDAATIWNIPGGSYPTLRP